MKEHLSKKVISIAMLMMIGACTAQEPRTAVLYDDPQYPAANSGVVEAAPDNVGKVVITAASGRPVQCGTWPARGDCERVRLLPGLTIVRVDYTHTIDGRPTTAKDMDLPINVQGGHTYHIVATVARNDTAPQIEWRVTVQAVDKGEQPRRP